MNLIGYKNQILVLTPDFNFHQCVHGIKVCFFRLRDRAPGQKQSNQHKANHEFFHQITKFERNLKKSIAKTKKTVK